MKRIILSLVLVLFCHSVFAQSSIKYKQLIVKGSDTYINDNGKQYLQDKTVLTLKLKPDLTDKHLNPFKVDRINKLGYYTTLQVDSLNHFHCTVIKDSIAPINQNIYATLYYNGDSITTIKKKIYGHMKKGKAFYLLKRYPQGNIIDAALLKPNNTINITTGQFYTINSVNIGGMNVEEFTVYPYILSRYMWKEEDNIRIKIDSNGSVVYRVWGYDESGTLEEFKFTIHANSSTPYMAISKSDNILTVELKESEADKSDIIENVTVINDDMEWAIGVTNALKGKQILAKKVKGKSTSFNTNGWPQGLYVIRAIVNGEKLTEKIYINNK